MARPVLPLLASLAVANGLALVPVAASCAPAVALSAVAFLGIRKARREERAFFSMEWRDPIDAEEESSDACVVIGEETVEDGKVWYVCSEKTPDKDCTPVSNGWGNPDHLDAQWLCKEPKPK